MRVTQCIIVTFILLLGQGQGMYMGMNGDNYTSGGDTSVSCHGKQFEQN